MGARDRVVVLRIRPSRRISGPRHHAGNHDPRHSFDAGSRNARRARRVASCRQPIRGDRPAPIPHPVHRPRASRRKVRVWFAQARGRSSRSRISLRGSFRSFSRRSATAPTACRQRCLVRTARRGDRRFARFALRPCASGHHQNANPLCRRFAQCLIVRSHLLNAACKPGEMPCFPTCWANFAAFDAGGKQRKLRPALSR